MSSAPKDLHNLPWTLETMEIINRLTPSIEGKAFDPDWFLLRQRFEAIERKGDHSFWAIEKFENGRSAGYFAGGDMFKDFVTDIEQALQFRRKRDAERVAGFMFGDVRATEHCYIREAFETQDVSEMARKINYKQHKLGRFLDLGELVLLLRDGCTTKPDGQGSTRRTERTF